MAALEDGTAAVECYRFNAEAELSLQDELTRLDAPHLARLALVTVHGSAVAPANDRSRLRTGDLVFFAAQPGRSDAGEAVSAPDRWTRVERTPRR